MTIKYWEVCVIHSGFLFGKYIYTFTLRRSILTAGVPGSVFFLRLDLIVREIWNLSAFPFSNFQTFIFQPFHFLSESDVRQIFDGSDSIVREIYVLSFEIVVLVFVFHTSFQSFDLYILPYDTTISSPSILTLYSVASLLSPLRRSILTAVVPACPYHS